MLGIALKTTQQTELKNSLSRFISYNHSKSQAKDLTHSLETIDKTRETIRSSLNILATEYGGGGLDKLQSNLEDYSKKLISMSLRFKFGQGGGLFSRKNIREISIPFYWKDSFRNKYESSSFDIYHELSAILFNVAACYSLQAINEDRTSSDGLKAAFKLFQKAAGVFDYMINECASKINWKGITKPTRDLDINCLKMLQKLMLAQAQACFFEKAVKHNVSPKLISKLAAGASQLFSEAFDCAQQNDVRKWLDLCKYPWRDHLNFQKLCFSGGAYYWKSKILLKTEGGYGREISYLQHTQKICGQASQISNGLISALESSKSKLYKLTTDRLEEAIDDNQLLHHDPIEGMGSEEKLDSHIASKPIPFSLEDEEDPFDKLVPSHINEASLKYKKQLQEFIRETKHLAIQETDTAKAIIASMGLPGSLEAVSGEEGLPQSLWKKINEAQLKGCQSHLVDRFKELGAAAGQAMKDHQAAQKLLQEEADDDAALKAKFGAKWNRLPSTQITASFKKSLEEIKTYLTDAGKSDMKIKSQLQKDMALIQNIGRSKSDIEETLPRISKDQTTEETIKLRAELENLNKNLEERDQLIEQLEGDSKDDDCLQQLMKRRNESTDKVIASEMKKYEIIKEKLLMTMDGQKDLLKAITEANEKFLTTKNVDKHTSQRQEIIQDLNLGVEKFNQILVNLNEGGKFYGDIIRDYIEPLKFSISDYCFARKTEKEMLLSQIIAKIGKDVGSNQNVQNNPYLSNNNDYNPPSYVDYDFDEKSQH